MTSPYDDDDDDLLPHPTAPTLRHPPTHELTYVTLTYVLTVTLLTLTLLPPYPLPTATLLHQRLP